jgi:hypothetical protein
MSASPFVATKDLYGVVHTSFNAAYSVLERDNSVDYVDAEITFCDEHVTGHWEPCGPEVPLTCVQCLAAVINLTAAAYTYLGTKTGRMSIGRTDP